MKTDASPTKPRNIRSTHTRHARIRRALGLGALLIGSTSGTLHADVLGEADLSKKGQYGTGGPGTLTLSIGLGWPGSYETIFSTPIDTDSTGDVLRLTSGPEFDAAVESLTDGQNRFVIVTISLPPSPGSASSGFAENGFFGNAGCNGIDLEGYSIEELRLTLTNVVVDRQPGQVLYETDCRLDVIGDCSLGTQTTCPAEVNSTNAVGRTIAFGSLSASANELRLQACELPNNSFGIFMTSQTQGLTMNPMGSQGNLCLGGSIGLYSGPNQVQSTGSSGSFELAVDLTQTPQPSGPVSIAAGESWIFQAWFRDEVGGTYTSNFTDSIEITFQ